MRIVVDTCVLVAGFRSRDGASFQILRAIGGGMLTPLLSVPLMLEYEAVLKRPKHLAACVLSADEVDTVLDVVAARGKEVALYYLWRPVLPDPADEMVLEVAVQGGAQAIVTHNTKDFQEATNRFGMPVWTPRHMLGLLTRKRQ